MRGSVTEQDAANLKWGMQPFVWVEGHGIGARNAGDAIGVRGGDRQQRADAAIDVEPETLVRRQVRERFQIIDGAAVDRAGRCDEASRLKQ